MAKGDFERFTNVFNVPRAVAKLNRLQPGVFTAKWLETVEILDAEQMSPTKCRALYRFPATAEYMNPAGNLHGGAIAMIFDVLTSTLMVFVMKAPDFWLSFGVSRTLNLTYLRPAPLGEMLLVEVEMVQLGKRMAVIKGVMKLESNGKEVALCEHGKYNDNADAKI